MYEIVFVQNNLINTHTHEGKRTKENSYIRYVQYTQNGDLMKRMQIRYGYVINRIRVLFLFNHFRARNTLKIYIIRTATGMQKKIRVPMTFDLKNLFGK